MDNKNHWTELKKLQKSFMRVGSLNGEPWSACTPSPPTSQQLFRLANEFAEFVKGGVEITTREAAAKISAAAEAQDRYESMIGLNQAIGRNFDHIANLMEAVLELKERVEKIENSCMEAIREVAEEPDTKSNV